MVAGFLKSWKRRYFCLQDDGLVCYPTREATTPLFHVFFTSQTVLTSNPPFVERKRSIKTPSYNTTSLDLVATHRRGGHSDALTLTLEHVEATNAVESPLVLKAENDEDYVLWMECLAHTIDVRTGARLQVAATLSDMDKMFWPAQKQFDDWSVRLRLNDENNGRYDPRQAQVESFEAFSSTYMLLKEIGEGSFSIVHRAVNRRTSQMCAVKCCKVSQALAEEERLLRTFSHPNLVQLHGVYKRSSHLHYVVMDYLKDGDLCDLLIERQRLTETESRRLIRQVVEGLAYLHRRCVLHRDIKPENILIHGNLVKIADFGLAKELEKPTSKLTQGCGTLEYAAPEVLCGQPYGLKSDVFSLGIVLYVLLFGAFPFSVESAAALQQKEPFLLHDDVRDMSCLSRSNVLWRSVSPLAQDVVLKMLKVNDAERISAKDLLGHPWFTNIDEESGGDGIPNDFELVRIEDCEALGFAELLSRGFQVVKYGHKNSTLPHSTLLAVNYMEECITWTARDKSKSMRTSGSNKRGRVISLREIQEINEGHTTKAFLFREQSNVIPRPELCLSIVCPWRTLDIVMEAPSQRDFMVRGLQRLLGIAVQ